MRYRNATLKVGRIADLPLTGGEVAGRFTPGDAVLVLLAGVADSVVDERDVQSKDDLIARIHDERVAGPGQVDPAREERSKREPVGR